MPFSTAVLPKFPKFSDEGTEVILKCDCKSALAVSNAGGEFISAGQTFNEDGVLLGSGANTVDFKSLLTTEQKSKMEKGFVMAASVEKGFFSVNYLAIAAQYLFGFYSTSVYYFGKSGGTSPGKPDLKLRNANGAGFSLSNIHYDTELTADSHVKVTLFKRGAYTTVYLDEYPFLHFRDGALSANPFDQFFGLGGNQFGNAITDFRIKDFIVTTNPFDMPVDSKLTHVAMTGTSYFQQGDYTLSNSNEIAALSYSSASSVPGSGAVNAGYNRTICQTIQSSLLRKNKGLGNGRLFNHAKGGSKLFDVGGGLAFQIAAAVSHSSVIDVMFIFMGANEHYAGATRTWDEDYGVAGVLHANWEVTFQTELTKLITVHGCEQLFILNQPYFSKEHPDLAGEIYISRVDDMNASLSNLVNANLVCTLIDVNTLFGGLERISSMWGGITGADKTHPSMLGQQAISNLMVSQLTQTV